MDRVAIVGGSLAGCAAATALRRAGCEVTVFERAEDEFRSRGTGLSIPTELHAQLRAGDYLGMELPAAEGVQRVWFVEADGERRTMWHQLIPNGQILSWKLLWRALRATVPDSCYHRGRSVVHARPDDHGTTITFADGTRTRFDMVIGADGYRSRIRRLIHPEARLAYAGYVLWRGTCMLHDIADPELHGLLRTAAVTVCFTGGHSVMYPIPSDTGARVTWGIYITTREWSPTDDSPGSPPRHTRDRLLADLLERTPDRASLIEHSSLESMFVQPVYDLALPRYIGERALLVGDAATVARPHTAAGAVKALQDAIALEQIVRNGRTWDEILAAYDAERCGPGNSLVALGRRLGHAQVEHTPPWKTMTPETFQKWIGDTMAGNTDHYLYTQPR